MSRPRLGITTTADRALVLSETATEKGLQPVVLPCIEVVPAPEEILREAAAQADHADWLLVTSARAVLSVWPDGGMPSTRVAAVGAATAAVVADAGGSVAVVGDGGAGSLVENLRGEVAGKTVLFPHAAGAGMDTVGALREMGAQVTPLPVYETRAMRPGPDPVDAVVFGSPSAVEGWSKSRSFHELVLGAIGPTTAAALTEMGHQADVVPVRPDYRALIALVAKFMRDRSPV